MGLSLWGPHSSVAWRYSEISLVSQLIFLPTEPEEQSLVVKHHDQHSYPRGWGWDSSLPCWEGRVMLGGIEQADTRTQPDTTRY